MKIVMGVTDRAEIEHQVDLSVDEFSTFMAKVDGPLTKPEKAIIKTYVAYMLGLHERNATTESGDNGETNS